MNASRIEEISLSWLATARRPAIVRRSVRIAAIVGTLLVAINYADRWLAGTLVAIDFIKMGLTYLVPYCVSTFAAVAAIRDLGHRPSTSSGAD